MKTWIVVISKLTARIFEQQRVVDRFSLVTEYTPWEGAQDITILQGSADVRERGLGSSAVQGAQRARLFRRVSNFLNEELTRGSFDKLVIIADQRLLDEFCSGLSSQVRERISSSIPKDLYALRGDLPRGMI